MQIKGLHRGIYTLSRYANRHLIEERSLNDPRQQVVDNWTRLRQEKVSEKICQQVTGISRSSYYRYKAAFKDGQKFFRTRRPKKLRQSQWTQDEEGLVLKIRLENRTYGKEKIHQILRRDYHFTKSESTVGRILKKLKGKGLVPRSISALRQRHKRKFEQYAKRWHYDIKAKQPGEMVQIDHMNISKNQVNLKHFQAWDPKSKFIHAGLYNQATSKTAKKFLLELIEKTPFPIKSVQVDGGSEFMLHFEEACSELRIELFVLPPKRPQYNGGVERGNRIFREEFYALPSLANTREDLNIELKKALDKYNNFRPHHSLDLKTPMEYIRHNYPERFFQSHMY